MREPVRCRTTGLWLARYRDRFGRVRQAGRFERKSDARASIRAAESALNGRSVALTVSLLEFFEDWEARFPRHPRTVATNRERLRTYIFPNLPRKGDIALAEIRRPLLRDVQDRLLRCGLAKETIDGAFASLSALLTDAVDDELIEANPASRFRVRPNDPRLDPIRPKRVRRSVPPDEVSAFMDCVPAQWRALCWAPVMSGARPGELFAMHRDNLDSDREAIYLCQTVDRYGHLQDGLKTTHHIREADRQGRWTLFPQSLLEALADAPRSPDGWLFPTPRGRLWSIRNFYRTVWDPARRASGTDFTLYDLRHTFASRLQAAGIPAPEVSAWMGHSLRAGGTLISPSTQRYTHPTGDHTTKALQTLAELMQPRPACRDLQP
jgi:integrase